MRDWGIHWRSAEFYGTRAGLYVSNVPWWTMVVERVAEWVDVHIFRDRWCSPWEWTFHVPTYSFKSDEDGFLDHSVGSGLFHSFQWVMAVGYRHRTGEMSIDLTDEWLAANGQKYPFENEDDHA